MLKKDFISTIIPCFARFVSRDVRKQIFKVPSAKRTPEYKALYNRIMELPEKYVIDAFSDIIISVNDKIVAEKIKSQKGTILFVEYGNVKLDDDGYGIQQADISITVASGFSETNSDMITEALIMERNFTILDKILTTLRDESNSVEWDNPLMRQIEFPATIYTVESNNFYGNIGWIAMFKRQDHDEEES